MAGYLPLIYFANFSGHDRLFVGTRAVVKTALNLYRWFFFALH